MLEYFPKVTNDRMGNEAIAYNTITPSDIQLNSLGKEGWEVVTSYLEMETAFPNFGNEGYVTGIRDNIRPQKLVIILKRPLEEN